MILNFDWIPTHPYYLQEGMTLVGCKRMGEEVKKALAAL